MRSITRVWWWQYKQRSENSFCTTFLLWIGCVVLFGVTGCRGLSDPTLPAGTQSPDTYLSRAGGLMLNDAAERQFKDVWREVAIKSGLFTDELTNRATDGSVNHFDHRDLSDDDGHTLYTQLHKLRGQAGFARAVLVVYAPDLSPAIRGRLYAFEAYAEIWLADMYCSGVPLSSIDFQGDYTNRPPSTTDEIYAHAIALFDSALALAADSVSVQTLARIGKGRALLALARYAEAEEAVKNVQVDDSYQTVVRFRWFTGAWQWRWEWATVSDNEGLNGLAFRSSGDPRTAVQAVVEPTGSSSYRGTAFIPSKYDGDSVLIVIAGGVDAQLIKAEHALQRNDWDAWLSILNGLRTTGEYTRIDTMYTDATKTMVLSIDTVWQAGTGGVAGLRPLTDPGTMEDRVALLFTERAAWLFVTGQRQGDLRRLVRKYKLFADDIYPTGAYLGVTTTGVYGNSIDIPIPPGERQNPLFKGCLNRD